MLEQNAGLYERKTLERIRAKLLDETEAFECESVRQLILRAVEDQLEPYRSMH